MKRILPVLLLLFAFSVPAWPQADVRLNCYNPYSNQPINAWTPCASAPIIQGNGTGTTGAVVGTLTSAANHTAYICGFSVNAVGTLAVGPITIAGLIGASQVWQLTATATGSSVGTTYNPCIPASALNTNITVTTSSDASASAVDVNSWGYLQ